MTDSIYLAVRFVQKKKLTLCLCSLADLYGMVVQYYARRSHGHGTIYTRLRLEGGSVSVQLTGMSTLKLFV